MPRVEKEPPRTSRRGFLKLSGMVLTNFLVNTVFPNRSLAQEEERPVSQTEEAPSPIRRPVYWGNRNRPEVALTFDDGFSRSAIEKTLEVLGANNLRGTFFVIGSQLRAYPELWQQALVDGHEICNHTQTHPNLTTLSLEQIRKELSSWEESAQEVLGEEYLDTMRQNYPYIRFPGGAGHKDDRVLRAVTEAGYWPIAWSAETYAAVLKKYVPNNRLNDGGLLGPIAQEVSNHIIRESCNGMIILLHFNSWDTLYLDSTIRGIIDKKGLELTTVSQVLREEPETPGEGLKLKG